MLANIGILGALILTVLAGSAMVIESEALLKSDFKNFLTYNSAFRSQVLKVLKEEHPDFKLQYNISLLDYRQPPRKFSESGMFDLEHVLCCTEDPPVSSWASLTGVRWHNFGNFWLFFEYPPNFRNLTAAANIIADNIAIQRLVTIQHLLRRHGLENYFWPENLIFTCDITLGSFCGLTTFSVMSFGLLATCVCGCFMMYFSVLLLDTKELEQKEGNPWDVEQEENTGLIQWMNLATPLLSLLFFLLTAGLVAGFIAMGHVAAIRWMSLSSFKTEATQKPTASSSRETKSLP